MLKGMPISFKYPSNVSNLLKISYYPVYDYNTIIYLTYSTFSIVIVQVNVFTIPLLSNTIIPLGFNQTFGCFPTEQLLWFLN